LKLQLPIGLILIDVGGGVKADAGDLTVELQEIECIPLRRILKGLLMPGMWSTEPVPLSFRDFVSGMGHTAELTLTPQQYGSRSLAIISKAYLNLSLRFGYHFTMVDCVASPERSANYIYFRFVGGITEMARRKRRAQFLCNVLSDHDFSVSVRGDLVLARVTKMSLPMMEERLVMLGRLIGFSRQLDILMSSEESVARYTEKFLDSESPLEDGTN
jgi:pyruvate,water dikinase